MNEVWEDIGRRISANAPVDLDQSLFTIDGAVGGSLPNHALAPLFAPSAALWLPRVSDGVAIGVRVRSPLDGIAEIAARLVAMAIERNIVPVILSELPRSGFERFGFRLELLSGETADDIERCVTELRRFWDIAIVVDADQMGQMG